ncbi:nitroreductase family protein [Streptomyces avidinii]|uniref:nitroreductase family protein n=1 Tax=Streptomyces avidinii TaxID=1895 RepID=UPI00386A2953|nr:nitroreductase family protein [Streptomyces avidinii]
MPLVQERDLMAGLVERLAAGRGTPAAGPTGSTTEPVSEPVSDSVAGLTAYAGALWEVLEARRSLRSFDARRVAAAELSTVLARAFTTHRAQWPERPAVDLTVLLAAYRVEALAPGWYEVGPDGAFREVADAPELPDAAGTFDDAPAVLLIGGDLAGAVGRAGHAGYADLLVRGAALAHTCWLTAIGAGFGGCPRGRAEAVATTAFHTLRPGGRHLLSLTLGRPGTAPQPLPVPGPNDAAAPR